MLKILPNKNENKRNKRLIKVKAKNSRKTIIRLWQYLQSSRISLLMIFILVVISILLSLINPYLMGQAVDKYLIPGDYRGLAEILVFMGAIYLLVAGITWLQNFMMIEVAQRTVRDLRKDLFDKLQTFSIKFFDTHSHGELMSRITNDVENISNSLTQSIINLMSSFLTVAGIGIVMLSLNWQLALVSLLIVPLLILVTRYISGKTRKGFADQQGRLGDLNGMIEETINGQQIVKIFGQEEDTIKEFQGLNNAYKDVAIKAQILADSMPPSMNMLNNLSFALISGAGSLMAIKGLVSIGLVVAFLSYSKQFSSPLNHLAYLYNSVQIALASAERVFEIMDEKTEMLDKEDAVSVGKLQGDVLFHNVDFSYAKGVKVLKNISLEMKRGETFALVGPTGAGKTTIINLLTRFYDIDSGNITIDGLDIRELKMDSLRSRLGVVLQDTYLFTGTVMDNIRYGNLGATDEEVMEASRMANAHQFIHRLPQGYNTLIKREGNNISHGQRQLIAIARTILADPDILILDEATSSVDTRTEMHIQEALHKLMQGRTSLVIAHRLSTIKNADAILVIDQGEIVEQGTHEELLVKKGFYYNLYMSQFKECNII